MTSDDHFIDRLEIYHVCHKNHLGRNDTPDTRCFLIKLEWTRSLIEIEIFEKWVKSHLFLGFVIESFQKSLIPYARKLKNVSYNSFCIISWKLDHQKMLPTTENRLGYVSRNRDCLMKSYTSLSDVVNRIQCGVQLIIFFFFHSHYLKLCDPPSYNAIYVTLDYKSWTSSEFHILFLTLILKSLVTYIF